LHDYLVAAVYGDWLKDDGQTDKSVEQQSEAVDLLDGEIAQITQQQKQTQRYRVRVR
jgi:glycerol-3-phosphate responsive antiterminator